MLACTIGNDGTDILVDFNENGKVHKKNLSYVLKHSFAALIDRIKNPLRFFFEFLIKRPLTPKERIDSWNIAQIK
jgi:hypothetical protein